MGKLYISFLRGHQKELNKFQRISWKVEKDADGSWEIPLRLNNSINSEKNEYSPRTDQLGNLYFASDRSGGYGQGYLYFSKKEKDTFSLPINLGNVINSDKGEWNLEINDDGT